MRPNIDDFVVALTVSDKPITVLLMNPKNLFISLFHQLDLGFRYLHLINRDGQTSLGGIPEPKIFYVIKQRYRFLSTHLQKSLKNKLGK